MGYNEDTGEASAETISSKSVGNSAGGHKFNAPDAQLHLRVLELRGLSGFSRSLARLGEAVGSQDQTLR